ncbi:alpha/beta hydrolase family protein [Flagellimonas iocasae]|uniref:Alpha/beta hydrolase family protein n=1 Tax=Flagellimonas iocasae TaxID=2055905 RepID=A0ABW4Y160_9FLAO
MKHCIILWICFNLFFPKTHSQEEEIDFFEYWESYSDIENSLFKHFSTLAYDQLNERRDKIDKLKTAQDWLNRQSTVKQKLLEMAGPFPEKTPLNPQITEVLQRDGYRIEKVIYESLPQYYVTGALYVPDGVKKNAPAIFYACGHSLEGFRSPTYQHIIINLVKKGFVVFTIDPMGQGERYEYWGKKAGRFEVKYPDHEHSFAGAQCLISGYSTGNYFIWDVIRGIDYMLSRKEVDPNRIGMTGRSGGGNLTAYVGALDDRILATAPECYITSYEYIYRTIGPQCAEQNLYQMIAKGLDHGDFIEARAPKPILIISTTRDFFSIQGARETFQEAQNMYSTLGKPENLRMVEDDDRHSSTTKNRKAMYAFFQKELNNPGSPEDIDVEVPTIKELQVTKTGQLTTSFKTKSIYELNKDKVKDQEAARQSSRKDFDNHASEVVASAAEIAGFTAPTDFGKEIFSGRFVNPDHTMEKYLLQGSGDYKIPSLVLKPLENQKNETILYFDSAGMEHAIKQDSAITQILNEGYTIVLADLPGIGSLGPGYLKGDSYIEGVSYNQWFGAMLVGKSFVGLRAEDIIRVLHFSKNVLKPDGKVSAIAVGPLGGELLHAAAFDKRIEKVAMVESLLSYSDITSTQFYKTDYIPFTVPGALEKYDLPDLMASLFPRSITVIDPVSADGAPADRYKIDSLLEFPLGIYTKKGRNADLTTHINASKEDSATEKLIHWLRAKD